MEGFEIKLARQITKAWSAMTFFSAEDFENYINAVGVHNQVSAKMVADIAEGKLQREAKVVYGLQNAALSDMYFSLSKDDADTHRALLICVEEIERKSCEHVEIKVNINPGINYFECTKCGARLKPTAWEVV